MQGGRGVTIPPKIDHVIYEQKRASQIKSLFDFHFSFGTEVGARLHISLQTEQNIGKREKDKDEDTNAQRQ